MECPLPPIPFTDDEKARLCGVLSVGCDRQTAVNMLGCSLADLRRAMQADAAFAAEVCRAEAGAELAHMRSVQQAAKDVKNWRASVWWLERHAPERFGARPAGIVTARQLKAFVDIVAAAVCEHVHDPNDRDQLVQQLKSLAGSIDQMLRDSQLALEAAATNELAEIDAADDTGLLDDLDPTGDGSSDDILS